jgi:hypothetical protein
MRVICLQHRSSKHTSEILPNNTGALRARFWPITQLASVIFAHQCKLSVRVDTGRHYCQLYATHIAEFVVPTYDQWSGADALPDGFLFLCRHWRQISHPPAISTRTSQVQPSPGPFLPMSVSTASRSLRYGADAGAQAGVRRVRLEHFARRPPAPAAWPPPR